MELLTPDIGLVAWSSVAFLLLLFLLKKFAWKPILSSLEERNTSIEEALAQAEKARKEIADLSARNEEILKEAKEERNNILREANKVKEQIVAEAKEKAQADAAKIMLEAKEDIEVQKKAVMADMKNAAASLLEFHVRSGGWLSQRASTGKPHPPIHIAGRKNGLHTRSSLVTSCRL